MREPHSAQPGSNADAAPTENAVGYLRWWTYQAERFPLVQNGPLVLVFSASAVSYSHTLRGRSDLPSIAAFVVAFVTCLLFFLQLRIADEFKDFEEDSLYRPYRPVPRGLIKLRELGVLFVLAGALQLGLAFWLSPWLTILLGIAWAYLAAMSNEFFVRDWLKARPLTYLWSHMFIMPLVDLYATGCDWLAAGEGEWRPPSGLIWFLAASYFNGVVIELGRKIRTPVDEERGVQTYSVLWGRRQAVIAWLTIMLVTLAFATAAAWRAGATPVVAVPVVMFLVAVGHSTAFLKSDAKGAGRRIELLSGLWTICLYLSLGIGPIVAHWWRSHP